MADGTKITQMPAAGPISESDLFPIVQGGITKRATRAQVVAGLQAALGFAPEDQTNRNARNGYVGLIDGKIDPAFFPSFGNLSERFPVDNEPEMLALNAEPGDIAVRSDEAAVFVLMRSPANDRANWVQLEQPAIGVTDIDSAAGTRKTGSVRLNVGDLYDLSRVIRDILAAQNPGEIRNVLALGSAALEPRSAFASVAHAHTAASRSAAGFMTAADKARLDNLVVEGQATPTGAVMRFPKTLKALPGGYLELTGAVQRFDPGTHPVLEEVLGLTNEPGTPGGFVERQRLQASDAAANDQFGWSVAISGDGKTLAIGSYLDDNSGGENAGSVYVYNRTGSTWAQQTRLQASGAAAGDQFGRRVSISYDGGRIAVAAPSARTGGLRDSGAVFVFDRVGSTWSQQARLQASDAAADDSFGSALAISADGSFLAVGAFADDNSGGADAGSVYVYNRSGSTWSQQIRLQASDAAANDRFGWSVSLSDDATVLAVGSYLDDNSGGVNAGSVYVYTRAGSTWSQQTRLQASDATASDQFGQAIALSGRGDTLAVGSPNDDNSGGADAGSVYVYNRSGSTWSEQTRLQASDAAATDLFGWSIAISADGNIITIGAFGDDNSGGADAGSVYVYNRSGSTWSEQTRLQASDAAAADRFGGLAVAISADGNVLAIGAHLDDNSGGQDAGSVYAFERMEAVPGALKLQIPARPDDAWTWAIKD